MGVILRMILVFYIKKQRIYKAFNPQPLKAPFSRELSAKLTEDWFDSDLANTV